MARHVYVKESALVQFSTKCGATAKTRSTIAAGLRTLGQDAEAAGYEITAIIPSFWQMKIGDCYVHYGFDDQEVTVLYVGIPGVC